MPLFDSHCHLQDRRFDKDRGAVIQKARLAGVKAMMIVGTDAATSANAVALAATAAGLYASVGVHPHCAENCSHATLSKLAASAVDERVKAWGEIGLDYFRMRSEVTVQERWFVAQLEVAVDLDLPVILHERNSGGRLLSILKELGPLPCSGVIHCFGGTENELEEYLDLGLYIGVTGIVTMKERGERLRRMVACIPAQRVLIETDAPYLTPAPQSGHTRRNQPAFLAAVLDQLCRLYRRSPNDLSRIVWENTCRLYRVPSKAAEGRKPSV